MDIICQRSQQEAAIAAAIDDHLITGSTEHNKQIAVLMLELRGTARLRAHPGGERAEKLIRRIHQSISKALRPHDRVDYFSDSEAMITLFGINNSGHARLAVRKLLHDLGNIQDEDGYGVHVAPLLGIALYPDVADSGTELLRKAALAADMARSSGQNFLYYDPKLGDGKLFNWNIEQEVERALRNDEFSLHYQPQIAIHNHAITGAEALLRWQHPEHGAVSPGSFIPLAERSQAIHPLTRWCLHTAMRQLSECSNHTVPYNVSVNISSYNLIDPGFAPMVGNALQLWNIPADRLTLEITEGALLEDLSHATMVLDGLRQQGIRISLDDFGTGYSSLAYLKHLPVDELKIDQSFVRNIIDEQHDRHIVETIIKIARDFDFAVVAEGIEQHQAMSLLGELGCHAGQGYAISHPMPHGQFCDWINGRDKHPTSVGAMSKSIR